MNDMMATATSKLKKKHFKVKHQKVKLFRANEPLLSVFMWGVNHTYRYFSSEYFRMLNQLCLEKEFFPNIQELTHINVPVMLMPDDFKAYGKIKVDNHSFNKENMPSHFKVKEYCPLVFRNLRERFSIDDQEYMNSWTKSQPICVDSSGRSGARFFQSYDKKFIIKSLQSEEVEKMHSLLKLYHAYIVERHGKTLLPQYLGMYRLTVEGAETYLVVMRNILGPRLFVHRKYDLKGSTVDREASDKEREKDLPTLKDNDFVKDAVTMHIGEQAKERLLEILNADVGFLSKAKLMDYSVLLAVHDCEKAEQEATHSADEMDADGENGIDEDEEDSQGSTAGLTVPTPPDSPHTGARNETCLDTSTYSQQDGGRAIDPKWDIYAIPSIEDAPKKEIYFMALVDVLTHYGVKKRTAQAAKTVKHGAGAEISTVHPEQYGKRLVDFISKVMV